MSVITDGANGFFDRARRFAACSGDRPPIPAPSAPPANRLVLAVGVLIALTLAWTVEAAAGGRMTVVYSLGVALGFTLFHSRFGFTSAWRQLLAVGQGAALRAHMLMLAVASVLFSVLLANGLSLAGTPKPMLAPIGVALLIGSFLFGVGMQLGGSCSSGTLFAVGSGQTGLLYTLFGFIAGSVLAIWNAPFWNSVPTGPSISLATTLGLGYAGALALSLAVMTLIVAITYLVGRRRQPPPLEPIPTADGAVRAIRGAWPLWVGAILLGVLNAAVLYVSGAAWGVTSAFGLWGSKILGGLGVDVARWTYWKAPANHASLAGSVFADRISVLDFGVIAGALIASALSGAFILHQRVPVKTVIAGLLGGILMGYGARLAAGCNIGAYFSGIASFSLHGWIWGIMAILGTVAGLALRPLFGLTNPKPSHSCC